MNFHQDRTQPRPDQIFVFGSNLAGIHGAGAAKQALSYGARYGVGVGFMGNTYAIPTKDMRVDTLPLDVVKIFVSVFVRTSWNTPDIQYFVTRVGCGLAGYTDAQIAPLFKECGRNCSFAVEWQPYLLNDEIY